MAAGDVSLVNRQKSSRGFTRSLYSAVYEWVLICLLFIDSMFSYLIRKFASSCELQTPCPLCSRLDHVLDKKDAKDYWGLICHNHKMEISSLVFCHAHNKLVDVHEMCETCLFSFATINKSNSETYRLLVGKLGEETELDNDPLLEGHEDGHLDVKHCSCCNEPWVLRGSTQKLVQSKSFGSEAVELDLPETVELKQDNLVQSDSPSVMITHRSNSGLDMSHVVYRELKVSSDAESEEDFSDDDGDANALIHGINTGDVNAVQGMQPKRHSASSSDDSVLEKLIDPVTVPEPSYSEFQAQSDAVNSLAGLSELGNGLEELSWQQADHKAELSLPAELISMEDVPTSPAGQESPIEVAKESKPISVDETHPYIIVREASVDPSKETDFIDFNDVSLPSTKEVPSNVSKDTEVISLDDVPSFNPEETAVDTSEENSIPRTIDVEHKSRTDCNETFKTGSGLSKIDENTMETYNASCGNGLQATNSLDLTDAYKIAVGNRGRQPSGALLEQWVSKDSSKLSEDLKQLLSQLSAARGTEFSTYDTISPKMSFNNDELKSPGASTSTGIQMLQKMISLERNESGLSLDGSIVSEIEGESAVDRLKRQVEHDRKLLSALYKELEEERSASTIAANQAMAMITRLQEEKATLHMEALQHLRMMEEQAEYDIEALNKTSDLLAEKEKEVQDLEAELEFYRKKYPNESMMENTAKATCDLKVRDITVDQSEGACVEFEASSSQNCDTKECTVNYKPEVSALSFADKSSGKLTGSLLRSEDERLYISQRLQKLEKMVNHFSANENEGHHLSELTKNVDREYELNSESENLPDHENVSPCVKEASESDSGEKQDSKTHAGIDIASLGLEVYELNDRLEALEADRIFLEHAVKSLHNGEEGLQFIQEIALHLRELRNIGIRRRNQTVA